MHGIVMDPSNPFAHFQNGNNKGTTIVHNEGFANNTRAVLILYPPKRIPDMVRRSHIYNFGDSFRLDVQNRVHEMTQPNSNLSNNFYHSTMMDQMSAHTAIIPDSQGQLVNLADFRERWTFILISDNHQANAIGATHVLNPTRLLYSGYVIDEPIMPSMYGGKDLTNPNAMLITTHFTRIGVDTAIGPNGMIPRISTLGDYDYLDPTIAQNINVTPGQLYNNVPSNLAKSIHSNNGTTEIAALPPMVGTITPSKPHVELSTDFNSPVSHLGCIVSGIADTINNTHDHSAADLLYGGVADAKWGSFATIVQQGANIVYGDIDPKRPISLGELEGHYGPSLTVESPPSLSDPTYDLGDPVGASKRQVFTSLISTSLPSIMANLSIAEVQFRYNSWMTAPGGPKYIINADKGVFEWQWIATLYGSGDQGLIRAQQSMERMLRDTLWPIILTNCKDFDVTLHVSLAGASLIDLKILSEGSTNNMGLIETSNMLGGLNSPIIGNINVLSNNALHLGTSMADLFTTGTPGDPFNMQFNGTHFRPY